MAKKKGDTMPPEITPQGNTPAPTPPVTLAPEMSADQAVTMERARVAGIRTMSKPFVEGGQISQDFVDGLESDGIALDMVKEAIFDELAAGEGQEPIMQDRGRPVNTVGTGNREARHAGIQMALAAKMSGARECPDERARPYMGQAIVDMAAEVSGQRNQGYGTFAGRENMMRLAMHSTSDFPILLEGAVNTVLADAYEDAERIYTEISREMTFNDFRPHSIVSGGNFPVPEKIKENGEIKMGTFGEGKETAVLVSYASGLILSRQMLVNDEMGAIQQVLDEATSVIPTLEESVFWDLFLSNPKLGDGKALFHADHGNVAAAGTGLTVDAVSKGRTALRKMKTVDGKKVRMNAPSILLVGPELETSAQAFVAQITATKKEDVNPLSGTLRVVVAEEITNKSWSLVVDPSKASHCMKHGFLDGAREPRVRLENPFGTQGTSMTLEHDFGAAAVNHRGAYTNAGL
jgi:hypothetical protein